MLATDEDWLKIGLDDMVVDCVIEALVKALRKAPPLGAECRLLAWRGKSSVSRNGKTLRRHGKGSMPACPSCDYASPRQSRDKLAKIFAAILIAIIVVCVVIIIYSLMKESPGGGGRGPYPTTRFSTTTTPSVYPNPPIFENCDDAHKHGRWDIPSTDPAYRPDLDHNHDGIACESRKPG